MYVDDIGSINLAVEFSGMARSGSLLKKRYGVMQGGVLSPKHFNEFLQDLGGYLIPKYGLKIGDIYLAYFLFADDIVFFSEFAESLQVQIDLFYKFCEIWNIIISIAKTKIVIYKKIYAKHSYPFYTGRKYA